GGAPACLVRDGRPDEAAPLAARARTRLRALGARPPWLHPTPDPRDDAPALENGGLDLGMTP
ncbi:hypothetical protein, partial [Nonomuraea ceibae]|uniref:hypothetical protein n=1 Tax=Nonomuraea ceibae TaxID=1935170 RepID=UPI001C5F40B7